MKHAWIAYVRAGACGACAAAWEDALRLLAESSPRLSVVSVPEQADVLVITGPVNAAAAEPLRDLLSRWAESGGRLLALAGDCALDGGIWKEYATGVGGVPLDWAGVARVARVEVPGDPPEPEELAQVVGDATRGLS